MIFGFGRKSKQDDKDDDEEEELDNVLFQGATNGVVPDLAANAKLVQAGLVPAKRLITEALSRRAEMIRLDTKGKVAAATFIIDGVGYPAQRMPAQAALAITQMFKLLAGLDIKVRNKPQAGGIKAQYDEMPYEVRVNVQPVQEGGERLIVRAENKKYKLETPRDLGYSEQLITKIRETSATRSGLIVVAGPPMSGVTTATIASLRCVDAYQYSILSIADMAGRDLAHVNMFAWTEGDGLLQTLQRARRTDADVILVDPLTKKEDIATIAEFAENVSIIAEMPAKDAADATVRISAATGNPQLTAANVRIVLSQMLIRLLCKNCRRAYRPSPKLLARVGLPPETKVLYRPPKPGDDDEDDGRKKKPDEEPEVCEACGGTGYRGRTGLIEVIEMTDGMKKVVQAGGDVKAIRAQARTERMQSFHSDALRIVVEGNTSLEELQRAFKSP